MCLERIPMWQQQMTCKFPNKYNINGYFSVKTWLECYYFKQIIQVFIDFNHSVNKTQFCEDLTCIFKVSFQISLFKKNDNFDTFHASRHDNEWCLLVWVKVPIKLALPTSQYEHSWFFLLIEYHISFSKEAFYYGLFLC